MWMYIINISFVNVHLSSFPIVLCGWLVLTLTSSYSRFPQDVVLGQSHTDFGPPEVYQGGAYIGYVPQGYIPVHHQVELHSRIARPNHDEWYKKFFYLYNKAARNWDWLATWVSWEY